MSEKKERSSVIKLGGKNKIKRQKKKKKTKLQKRKRTDTTPIRYKEKGTNVLIEGVVQLR